MYGGWQVLWSSSPQTAKTPEKGQHEIIITKQDLKSAMLLGG
jgi:hypothetical protein